LTFKNSNTLRLNSFTTLTQAIAQANYEVTDSIAYVITFSLSIRKEDGNVMSDSFGHIWIFVN